MKQTKSQYIPEIYRTINIYFAKLYLNKLENSEALNRFLDRNTEDKIKYAKVESNNKK